MDRAYPGLPRVSRVRSARRYRFSQAVDCPHARALEREPPANSYYRDIDRLDEVMEDGWRVIRVNKTHLGPGDVRR